MLQVEAVKWTATSVRSPVVNEQGTYLFTDIDVKFLLILYLPTTEQKNLLFRNPLRV